MTFENYEYLNVGLMNPIMMWTMLGIIVILAVIILRYQRKCHISPFKNIKKHFNTILAMIFRNVVGRYSDSKVGILWNVIMPVVVIILINVVFMSLKNVYPERNFSIYLCSGFFIVTACRAAIMGRSFYNNGAMLKKMNIPGWVIIFADTLVNIINLIIAVIIQMVAIYFITGYIPFIAIASYPLILIILFIFCFGCSLLISTLVVLSSDFGHAMVCCARAIIWMTPTFYYLCDSNQNLQIAAMWNPFTYFIEMSHEVLSYNEALNCNIVVTSILISFVVLLLGVIVYTAKIDKVRESI